MKLLQSGPVVPHSDRQQSALPPESQYHGASVIDFASTVGKFADMPRRLREPIQVYLSPEERAELDRAAHALGVSHSEALRRGIQAISGAQPSGAFRDLVDGGYLTSPTTPPGAAATPPSLPVSSLAELLAELDEDRADR